MKLMFNSSGDLLVKRGPKLYRGSDGSGYIIAAWQTGQSPDILTSRLHVEINIVRNDNQQSGWQPMTKKDEALEFYYKLQAFDLALDGKTTCYVRWFDINNATINGSNEITAVSTFIVSGAIEFIIYNGVVAQPLGLTEENYNALTLLYTQLNAIAVKKYNINDLDTAIVDYAAEGKKTKNSLYYDFVHNVKEYNSANNNFDTVSKTGTLLVVAQLTDAVTDTYLQSEYLITGGKTFVRTISIAGYSTTPVAGTPTDFEDICFNIQSYIQNYTYTKSEIDSKDAATLQSAKNYTYAKNSIDSKDIDTLNAAKAFTTSSISGIGNIQVLKGRKNSYEDLPINPNVGDVWLVGVAESPTDNLPEYVWTEENVWERCGSVSAADLYAAKVAYDNSNERLNANTVQEAIDELSTDLDAKSQIVELGEQTLSKDNWVLNSELNVYEYKFSHSKLTNAVNQAIEMTPVADTADKIIDNGILVYPHISTEVENGMVVAIIKTSRAPSFDMVVDVKLRTTTIVAPASGIFADQISYAAQNSGMAARNVQEAIDKLKETADGLDDSIDELNTNKVDVVEGKALSSNDFTTTLKNKLDGIEASADVNIIETIKVNNSTITPTNKTINLTIPTQASDVSAIPTSQKGAASGVAELDTNGKVPSSQLPSYVDDVLEYDALVNFPDSGETGKIYIDKTTNKSYRWSGSTYIEISSSLALGETSSTAYAGNKGKANRDDIDDLLDGTKKAKKAELADSVTTATNATNVITDGSAKREIVFNDYYGITTQFKDNSSDMRTARINATVNLWKANTTVGTKIPGNGSPQYLSIEFATDAQFQFRGYELVVRYSEEIGNSSLVKIPMTTGETTHYWGGELRLYCNTFISGAGQNNLIQIPLGAGENFQSGDECGTYTCLLVANRYPVDGVRGLLLQYIKMVGTTNQAQNECALLEINGIL